MKEGQEANPFSCPSGEVREDKGEWTNEHPGELIDDGKLLKDGCMVLEGGQEGHMAVPYPCCIFDKEVGKAVWKRPAMRYA